MNHSNKSKKDMEFSDIKIWVKSERNKREWTQAQLSSVSGVSIRTIQYIEKGKDIKISTIIKIAQSLDKQLIMGDKPNAKKEIKEK